MPLLLTSTALDRLIDRKKPDMTQAAKSTQKIRTEFCNYPFPGEQWCAYDENTYDVDHNGVNFVSKSPVGWGATEAEAIADLKSQLSEEA